MTSDDTTLKKLQRHLERVGIPWWPIDDIQGPICATTLDRTARLEDEAIARGIVPSACDEVEEIRPICRQLLAYWAIIPKDRVHLCPMDSMGRDADLRRFLNC